MRLCSLKCLLVVTVVIPTLSIAQSQSADREIRQTMNRAFDAMAYLLPLSLQAEKEIVASDRALIEENLSVLFDSSEILAQHSMARVPEFRMLIHSFDQAVERVSSSFLDEWYIDTYYALSDMAQNCVACHSRLADESDFLLGQKLFARMNTDELSRQDIAQLYIATRQFENALGKYEEIILDESEDPRDLDWSGVLVDYLQIGVVVKQDFQRLRSTWERFLKRDDLPLYMRHHVNSWLASMNQLQSELTTTPSLQRAREIFEQSTGLTLAPAGRARAVHDIVGAAVLRKLLENVSDQSREEIAEAYYLLGVITLRTLDPRPTVPEMEFLFEAAIRAAPDSEYAQSAYLLLEEYSNSNYMDFGSREIPDPDNDLRELRGLIE